MSGVRADATPVSDGPEQGPQSFGWPCTRRVESPGHPLRRVRRGSIRGPAGTSESATRTASHRGSSMAPNYRIGRILPSVYGWVPGMSRRAAGTGDEAACRGDRQLRGTFSFRSINSRPASHQSPGILGSGSVGNRNDFSSGLGPPRVSRNMCFLGRRSRESRGSRKASNDQDLHRERVSSSLRTLIRRSHACADRG